MTCSHSPRQVHGPGFDALLTANGGWTGYFADRPGDVVRVESCPGCGVPLWGLPGHQDAVRPPSPLSPITGV